MAINVRKMLKPLRIGFKYIYPKTVISQVLKDDDTSVDLGTVLETKFDQDDIVTVEQYNAMTPKPTKDELSSLPSSAYDMIQINQHLDELMPNNCGLVVDLKPYNSSENYYVFPKDGYVLASSLTTTSGLLRIPIRFGSINIAGIYMNITGDYQIQSVFVKKGMNAYVFTQPNVCRVDYYPLVN